MAAPENNSSNILERVAALERENRRIKRAGLAGLLVGACLILMGQARPSGTLEANEYILRDANGITTARLYNSPNGPLLDFLGNGGDVLASVGSLQRVGGQIFLKTRSGESLFLYPTGLQFSDRDSHERISMQAGNDGANLQLSDANGVPHATIKSTSHAAFMQLTGAEPEQVIGMATIAGPALGMSDGKAYCTLHILPKPGLVVHDAQGAEADLGGPSLQTITTGEKPETSAASLVLLGKDGKVLWSAPGK